MAGKKYWIKRSLLPGDKNDRAQVTKVIRWRVLGGKQMCATLGPNTIVEGDFADQPELEEYEKPAAKPVIKSEEAPADAAGEDKGATKSEKVSGKGKKGK